MSSNNLTDGQLPDLQFGNAEPINSQPAAQGLNCVICKLPIQATYFALGDQVLCEGCRDVVSAGPTGSGFVRFVKATCCGTLAGLLGAAIWYLIRILAHLEIGLVAILVGFMVGKAVHWASSGKGGIVYQLLAVVLTYGCISANYMPDIFQALVQNVDAAVLPDSAPAAATNESIAESIGEAGAEPVKEPMPADVTIEDEPKPLPLVLGLVLITVATFVLALSVPIVEGMSSPIGLLIVGFALWEAWKFSGHRPLPITGPYQVGQVGPQASV